MSALCAAEAQKPSPAAAEAAAAERRGCGGALVSRLLLLLCVTALCACLAVLEVQRSRQTAELHRQISVLQQRVSHLETGPETLHRSRRAVSDDPIRTIDGVPILERRVYGARRPRPQSEGLRIYETFSADRAAQPTAPAVNYDTDDPSIQPHHRSSAAYRAPRRYGRVNTNTVIAPDQQYRAAGAAAVPRRRAPAPGELHRRSRVSQAAGGGGGDGDGVERRPLPAAALIRSAASGPQSAPVLEARGAPPAFAPRPSDSSRQQERPNRRQRCPAAHYEAEVSSIARKAATYGGNGRLRNTNPDAMFTEWRAADWMERRRCGADFKLYGGQVTVRQPGLYFIYAQINYLEDSDINGFEIQVNARSLIKCITMEASDQREKTNTCYTGAVAFLGAGDAVSIRDLEPMRHSILLPDRSFFGLMRLSG